MATTTNYGWDTPDDTDLVKDGAAAIRTLGSSIDTTTKNLNPQTTTGALAYRSATSNVNTALPIGTAGQVLTVNSGATAPEWAAAASGSIVLINTTSFSAVASQSLTNVFSTTYDNYLILIDAYGSTTSTDILGRLGASASYDTGSNYSYGTLGINRAGGATQVTNGDALTSWELGTDTSTTTTSFVTISMTILSPFLAVSTNFHSQSWSRQGMNSRSGGGTHDLTNSYTDFQLVASTGTITGKISIYGYAK